MAEFSAIANLEVVPTGLDSARRTIERDLGDIEVGVTSNRPTGGRGAVGSRGPESALIDLNRRQLGELERISGVGDDGDGRLGTGAMIEIQRRTLVAQRASADFDEERNVILEDILDTLQGADGGGGGGFLRTAGTAGLAVRGASLLGTAASATPFLALAAAALLSDEGAAEQGLQVPGGRFAGGDGQEAGPGVRIGGPRGVFDRPQDFMGIPSPTERGQQVPAGRFDISIDPQVVFNAQTTMDLGEIQREIERRQDQFARDIRQWLERQLNAGTGTRTGGGGGGGGRPGTQPFAAKGNPFETSIF